MKLTSEQLKQVRAQLLKQIESLPEQQKASINEQIHSMNDSELEQFLITNKMIQVDDLGEAKVDESEKAGECIFCLILQGKVPSYKLDENKSSLAILDINPLSKGHSLVISKEHKKLSNSAFSLANKIAKRIKSKFNAEEVKIENSKILGHETIQIIPIYKDEKLEKKKASEEELILLKDKLESKPKQKKEKKIKQDTPLSQLPKAPRRIP